jgi:hypothetical protein
MSELADILRMLPSTGRHASEQWVEDLMGQGAVDSQPLHQPLQTTTIILPDLSRCSQDPAVSVKTAGSESRNEALPEEQC